jgi:two-component system NtrC family response regulator
MRILVVDDEKNQRESLAGFLDKLNHTVFTAESAQKALALLQREAMDIVLTDYKMPYMTGTDLLHEINHRHPTIVVLIMTAFGTIDIAVDAMKSGAWDFITKPVDLDQLEEQINSIEKYLGEQKREKTNRNLIDETFHSKTDFVIDDPVMLNLYSEAKKVANSKATVLITGETGTGKEVLAQFIHQYSNRSNKSIIMVNCTALPTNLVESELFGHEKGAFTGAAFTRKGRFEEADESTLFLDEIGDLPIDMQAKLLRFFQDGEFQRVGSNKVLKANVRVIAATNIELSHAVKQGNFREDLYYRLNVIHFTVPPLRERQKDIIPISKQFLKIFSTRENRTGLTFADSAKKMLLDYHYPGNVRELRNIIERAVLLCDSNSIEESCIKTSLQPLSDRKPGTLPDSVEQLEREMIEQKLDESNGNQSECARRLGISERVLRYKLQKYLIS